MPSRYALDSSHRPRSRRLPTISGRETLVESFYGKHDMTPLEKRSLAAKKAARSRAAKRAANSPRQSLPPYLQRVVDASPPGVSSEVVAERLGVTAAFVRKAWSRAGMPKRSAGAWGSVYKARKATHRRGICEA